MPYKGPGFYDEDGVRVCSFHPQSMTEYLSNLGFKMVEDMDEFLSFRKEQGDELWFAGSIEAELEEQQRRDEKNELYGPEEYSPRKRFQLDPNKWID